MIMAIAFVGFFVKAHHDLRRSFLFFFFGTNQLPKCYCLVRQLTQWVSKSKFRVAKVTTFILRVVTSDQKSSFASSAWFNSGGSFYSALPLLTTEHCSSWWFLQPVWSTEHWEHCTRKTMTRSERCCFADLFALLIWKVIKISTKNCFSWRNGARMASWNLTSMSWKDLKTCQKHSLTNSKENLKEKSLSEFNIEIG